MFKEKLLWHFGLINFDLLTSLLGTHTWVSMDRFERGTMYTDIQKVPVMS